MELTPKYATEHIPLHCVIYKVGKMLSDCRYKLTGVSMLLSHLFWMTTSHQSHHPLIFEADILSRWCPACPVIMG